jgi:hypothetical protein
MTAEVWYGRKPRPAHLQRALIDLLDRLGPHAEQFVLLSSFRLVPQHDDIALVVIKRDAIFIAEVCGTHDPIVGKRDGAWCALKPDGARIPLNAGRLNPFRQVQTHYGDLRDWLIAHRAEVLATGLRSQPADFADLFSYVVLYPDIPPGSCLEVGEWPVQIVSLSKFLTALTLRSSPHINLSPQQIGAFPRLLGLEQSMPTAPLGHPRRNTVKLEPDWQPPRVAALVALGHEFSAPMIRLQNSAVLHVGRDEDNEVIIRHPAVSRHHAELRREEGRWLVRDLGSDNGTYISLTGDPNNECAISQSPQVLVNRAVVRFGPAAYLVSL